jgi:hypothetical protein
MQKNSSIHDHFFRFSSQFEGVPRDLINLAGSHFAQYIDIENLVPEETSYITEGLKDFSSDLSFHTHFKDLCISMDSPFKKSKSKNKKPPIPVDISFLVEHKSFKPQNIREQLSKYLAHKASQELAAGKEPVFTIAIVFYHGLSKWVKQTAISEHSHIPPEFYRYIQEFDYALIDTANFTDEEIMSMRWTPLVNMLIIFKHFKDKVYLTTELDKIFYVGDFYVTSEEGRKFINGLLDYYFKNVQLRPSESRIIIKKIPKSMQTTAMSAYDQLREEAKEEQILQSVKKFLMRHPEFEDAEIAIILGTDVVFVRKIRAKLQKLKIIS